MIDPGTVLVIANSDVPQCVEYCTWYAAARGIPASNVIAVPGGKYLEFRGDTTRAPNFSNTSWGGFTKSIGNGNGPPFRKFDLGGSSLVYARGNEGRNYPLFDEATQSPFIDITKDTFNYIGRIRAMLEPIATKMESVKVRAVITGPFMPDIVQNYNYGNFGNFMGGSRDPLRPASERLRSLAYCLRGASQWVAVANTQGYSEVTAAKTFVENVGEAALFQGGLGPDLRYNEGGASFRDYGSLSTYFVPAHVSNYFVSVFKASLVCAYALDIIRNLDDLPIPFQGDVLHGRLNDGQIPWFMQVSDEIFNYVTPETDFSAVTLQDFGLDYSTGLKRFNYFAVQDDFAAHPANRFMTDEKLDFLVAKYKHNVTCSLRAEEKLCVHGYPIYVSAFERVGSSNARAVQVENLPEADQNSGGAPSGVLPAQQLYYAYAVLKAIPELADATYWDEFLLSDSPIFSVASLDSEEVLDALRNSNSLGMTNNTTGTRSTMPLLTRTGPAQTTRRTDGVTLLERRRKYAEVPVWFYLGQTIANTGISRLGPPLNVAQKATWQYVAFSFAQSEPPVIREEDQLKNLTWLDTDNGLGYTWNIETFVWERDVVNFPNAITSSANFPSGYLGFSAGGNPSNVAFNNAADMQWKILPGSWGYDWTSDPSQFARKALLGPGAGGFWQIGEPTVNGVPDPSDVLRCALNGDCLLEIPYNAIGAGKYYALQYSTYGDPLYTPFKYLSSVGGVRARFDVSGKST